MSTSVRGTDILFNDNSTQGTAGFTGSRNRIINGDMRIDQRNAGGNVSITSVHFITDRFYAYCSQASKFFAGQNAGAVTPPTGFTNYLGATTAATGYAINTTDQFLLTQKIEGYNFSDMAWGTAAAQTVTLSFWVRSSLTGNFGGAIQNSAQNRNYPFSFNISAANTWQQKTITIIGDTTGTWVKDSGIGAFLVFSLGTGSTYSAAAGAWTSSVFVSSASSSVSVVGTANATFYVTGVQLEAGSVATPFERVDYGRQLLMCQRYYYENPPLAGTGLGTGIIARTIALHPVEMRTNPTVSVANTCLFFNGYATVTATGNLTSYSNTRMFNADINIASGGVTGAATMIVQPLTGKITIQAEL